MPQSGDPVNIYLPYNAPVYLERLMGEVNVAKNAAFSNNDERGVRAYAGQLVAEQNILDIVLNAAQMTYNLPFRTIPMTDPNAWVLGIAGPLNPPAVWGLNIDDIDPSVINPSVAPAPGTQIELRGMVGCDPVLGYV